jgi:YfiH family protein
MNPPEPFFRLGDHFAVDLLGARVVFTTRRGGHSEGPYASLNLGRLTDDDPRSVALNRERLQNQVRAPLSFVRQVHGPRVCETTAASARQARPEELRRADGQVTRVRGIALAALTADCLPIAVAGDGAVAMLHAGWRGLADGIIAAGVRALRRSGAGGPVAAAIGPGAGPCCYEVGPEVHSAFVDAPAGVHRGAKLDLKAIARHELVAAGVGAIHDIGLCTICSDPALLYSHRRDHGVTGRQAGLAWLS